MTDSRLQALRREARSSGDPHSQARLLVERLRVAESCGECGGSGRIRVTRRPDGSAKHHIAPPNCEACAGFGSALRARVALAAYAGSEVARLVMGKCSCGCSWEHGTKTLGRDIDPHFEHQDDMALDAWLHRLSRWSARPFHALVRASLAAGEEVYESLPARNEPLPSPALQAIVAARRWLKNPDQANEVVWRVVSRGEDVPLWAPTAWTQWLRNPHGEPAWSRGAYDCVTQAGLQAGEPAIRTAIQEALVSWSLS